MRILSGKYKGSTVEGFQIVGTRPTMDRVKESMFAMIQMKVKQSVCLDLFAGSGNLGLEALSEGASSCYFFDTNRIAIETILKNIQKMKVEEPCVIKQKKYQDALIFCAEQNIKFDLVFLDPPYNENLITPVIKLLIEKDLLQEGAYVVCEYEDEVVICEGLTLLKERTYGAKKVQIYKKVS